MKRTLFLVAGEHSGDQRAAALIAHLRRQDPTLSFAGLGGRRMAEQGCTVFFDLPSVAVLGFTDVIKKYGMFRRIFNDTLKKIYALDPAALLLIDFPGFNLRLARAVKKRTPVIYYVSPQIWAWAPHRKYGIARHVDKMLTLFKFEKEAYKGTSLDVEWVGHPLVDQLNEDSQSGNEVRAQLKINPEAKVVGILPGSREKEIERILPVMLGAAERIRKNQPNTVFLVSESATVPANMFRKILRPFENKDVISVRGKNTDVLSASDFSMVCSGTATLEAAIIGTPFLVTYKTAYLTYLFARNMMHIPHIGMINVLAGKTIVPEFIQHNAKPDRLAACVLHYLNDKTAYRNMKLDIAAAKEELGEGGAAERTAEAVCRFLRSCERYASGASSSAAAGASSSVRSAFS